MSLVSIAPKSSAFSAALTPALSSFNLSNFLNSTDTLASNPLSPDSLARSKGIETPPVVFYQEYLLQSLGAGLLTREVCIALSLFTYFNIIYIERYINNISLNYTQIDRGTARDTHDESDIYIYI